MNFFKSKTNIIFSAVVLILSVSLICSFVIINKKNDYIKEVKTIINENETAITDAEKRINEYEELLKQKESTDSELQAQLEAAQGEKQRLEEENKNLKNQIANLKAQREAEKAIAVANQAQLPSGDKICYLTFDDGPSDNTLKILDILNHYGIKATFFVVNTSKISYIKNIHEAGHTVGLHSATHDYSKIYSGIDNYFNDLKTLSDIVESIIGIRSTVIRFPGGSSNLTSTKYCKGIMTQLVTEVPARGYSYFDWNVSSGDAERVTPSYTFIRNNVLNAAKTKNSACVLMHDTSAKTTTVQALPEIIEGLSAMGYSFDSLKPETFGFRHQKLNN